MGSRRADAFQQWVDAYGGAEKVALDLHVTVHAVHHWMKRKGWPKVLIILRIISLSEGKLSFEDIVRSTGRAEDVQQVMRKLNRGVSA